MALLNKIVKYDLTNGWNPRKERDSDSEALDIARRGDCFDASADVRRAKCVTAFETLRRERARLVLGERP